MQKKTFKIKMKCRYLATSQNAIALERYKGCQDRFQILCYGILKFKVQSPVSSSNSWRDVPFLQPVIRRSALY